MKSVCHIVCAGDFDADCFIVKSGDLVIACDAGLAYLEERGTVPDLVVGDFDSYKCKPERYSVVTLPREKDDTDSAYALKTGLSRGFSRFLLHGALGGARISHSLANLSLLLYLKERGAEGIICGKNVCAGLLDGGIIRFSDSESGYLSVFALTSRCDVTLENFKFPFSGTLSRSFPLGVSNEFIGKSASIKTNCGIVLWIHEGNAGDPARFFTTCTLDNARQGD